MSNEPFGTGHDGKPVPSDLMLLFDKLEQFRDVDWGAYGADDQRQATDELTDAVVVSSRVHDTRFDTDGGLHVVALDIDHPAWVVPSTRPGHYHLYIDKRMSWLTYQQVIAALVVAGVVEDGYAHLSDERGATHLRLPWIRKAPAEPAPMPEVAS